MFQIKICGVTTLEDARLVAKLGADAIGLNFCSSSPRRIDVAPAAFLVGELPASIVKVGVVVNAAGREACECFDRVGLDLLQLHGDETAEYVQQLGNRPFIRAIRCRDLEPDHIESEVRTWQQCRPQPRAILWDAFAPSAYGGTGKVLDWSRLAEFRVWQEIPWILAGGLRPDNVGQAIRRSGLSGVDTASGVESSPGRKDPELIRAFVAAARAALDATY